jgi:hypothetical protein
VDPQSSYFGGITLGLYVVPADPTAALTSGTGSVVSTSIPGQNVKRTFTGTSGQRLSFNFTNFAWSGTATPSVRVTVKTPSGGTLLTYTLTSNDFLPQDGHALYTLTASGTYTVTLDPQGAATGSLTMTYYVVPADAAATAPNPLTITTPGQNGVISFSVTGPAADRTFTVSTNVPAPDPCCVDSLELKVFQGSTQIGGSEFAGPSGYTFTRNLAAGSYTIVVDPFAASTGSVTVTIS